jgi:hypothetical protein
MVAKLPEPNQQQTAGHQEAMHPRLVGATTNCPRIVNRSSGWSNGSGDRSGTSSGCGGTRPRVRERRSGVWGTVADLGRRSIGTAGNPRHSTRSITTWLWAEALAPLCTLGYSAGLSRLLPRTPAPRCDCRIRGFAWACFSGMGFGGLAVKLPVSGTPPWGT